MTPKVSIIVPVYNVANYLPQCLESLISQTFSDIEIICFNDASTDNSLAILQSYAAKDSRIIIINSKVNLKQGGGRNRGIKKSRGEFIMFVDSDDWVAPTFVETLYNAVINNDAEIATSDYYESYQGKLKEVSHLGKNLDSISIEELKKKILRNGCRLWTSIFKRDLIFDNNLFFPEEVIYEDNSVGPALFLSAKSIVKLDVNLYYYRQIQTSTTKLRNNYKFFDRLKTSVLAIENIRHLPNYTELQSSMKDEIDWMFTKLYLIGTIYGILSQFNPIPIKKLREIFKEMNVILPGWKEQRLYKNEISYIRRVLIYLLEKYPTITCKFISLVKRYK